MSQTENTPVMPAVFAGHGSPMNAIESNQFTENWKKLGETIPRPKLIFCISAHWETKGTFLTSMPHPKTIHDFYGFPQELFRVEYPAPGNPGYAEQIALKYPELQIGLDKENWGFDHGNWSVVRHIYPNADIPMLQLSLNSNLSFAEHYELAKKLSYLRSEGVLIIGSGNIVHNLRAVDWHNASGGFEWAEEANSQIRQWIAEKNHNELTNITQRGGIYRMVIPTAEHYLPLLYVLAMQHEADKVSFFNDELTLGSISMTGVILKN